MKKSVKSEMIGQSSFFSSLFWKALNFFASGVNLPDPIGYPVTSKVAPFSFTYRLYSLILSAHASLMSGTLTVPS